jgi:hypothetical protein
MVLGAVLVSAQMGTFDPAAALLQTATSAARIDFAGLVLIGGDCILKLLLGAALYFLTRYFMTKKLNLT